MTPRARDSYRIINTTDGKWAVWRKQPGHAGSTCVGHASTREGALKLRSQDQLARSRKIRR